MRKLFAALFAVAMVVMLYVAVARSISSSPAETGAPYALEAECPQPGLAEAEQCACVHCSTLVANARFVETEVVRDHSICAANEKNCGASSLANDNGKVMHEKVRENAIASTAGTTLKLPMVAAVNVEMERDARSAARVEVEVLGVGV